MSKTCSCGEAKYCPHYTLWHISAKFNEGFCIDHYPVEYCPHCGDQLLPDGRIIQRESVPNRLMDMLREVQANCPETGLQEFALKVFNWIEEMREQAGLTEKELAVSACVASDYGNRLLNHAGNFELGNLLLLLNAAQKAKEAK